MKKIILSMSLLVMLFSCQSEDANNANADASSKVAHRGCASHEVHEEQLRQNPELALKMNKAYAKAAPIFQTTVSIA